MNAAIKEVIKDFGIKEADGTPGSV